MQYLTRPPLAPARGAPAFLSGLRLTYCKPLRRDEKPCACLGFGAHEPPRQGAVRGSSLLSPSHQCLSAAARVNQRASYCTIYPTETASPTKADISSESKKKIKQNKFLSISDQWLQRESGFQGLGRFKRGCVPGPMSRHVMKIPSIGDLYLAGGPSGWQLACLYHHGDRRMARWHSLEGMTKWRNRCR